MFGKNIRHGNFVSTGVCMKDYVVESSCGAVSDLSDAEKLQKNLFLPCLDRMVAEINQRYLSVNIPILEGVQACDPRSDNFLCEEPLWPGSSLQGLDEIRGGSCSKKLLKPQKRAAPIK